MFAPPDGVPIFFRLILLCAFRRSSPFRFIKHGLPQHRDHLPGVFVFERTIRRHRLVPHTFAAGIVRHSSKSLNIILPVPNRRFQSGMVMRHVRPHINICPLVKQPPNCFRLACGSSGNEWRQLWRTGKRSLPGGMG